MGLCCTQQDGSWLKVQELAAYVFPFEWKNSQSNLSPIDVKNGCWKCSRSRTDDLLLCYSFASARKLSQAAGGLSGGNESLLRSIKYWSYQ
jgi:hypothetical protein